MFPGIEDPPSWSLLSDMAVTTAHLKGDMSERRNDQETGKHNPRSRSVHRWCMHVLGDLGSWGSSPSGYVLRRVVGVLQGPSVRALAAGSWGVPTPRHRPTTRPRSPEGQELVFPWDGGAR